MLNVVKPLRCLVFALVLTGLGCRAQVPATGAQLSPDLHRRVEILIRSRLNVPPNYEIQIGKRTKSEVPNFDTIEVVFVAEGKSSKPVDFLLSSDGATLAQFNKYDISKDPKALVSGAGRPARGGPENAPVTIVGFDDLECPYCAKMHAQLFPALVERYKNQVRIVYRDFPIAQHPWARRAAVDTNCVGASSQTGYWNMVDYIHSHASDLGGTEKSLSKANDTLDDLARDEGKRQHLDGTAIEACLKKQDTTAIDASLHLGEGLGVEATPVLFINGEKLEGAYPIEDVFRMIDGALIAAGQTPPPATQMPVPSKPGN